MSNDVEIIKRYYKSIGFYNAEVDAKIRTLDEKLNRIDLIFFVDKGPRRSN